MDITLAKYLKREDIADLAVFTFFIHIFSSTEAVS